MSGTKKHKTRFVVSGKTSQVVVQHLQELLGSRGIEVGSMEQMPVSGGDSDCWVAITDSACQSTSNLRRLVVGGFNKTVILNLEDLELARLSTESLHEVFWISSKDPVHYLGLLLDGFQGAYLRGQELIVSIQNSLHIFPIDDKLPRDQKGVILATALIAKLSGVTDHQIQKTLEKINRIV